MSATVREEVGLSFWPMSSSYPVTRPELEARKMLRQITSRRKQETEVVLKTESPNPEESTTHKKEKGLCNIYSLCCLEQPESEPSEVDDVDGLAEDVLRPLVKLLFLKILLVDIGISLGDVMTDLLQGLSLVFDAEWNVQWSTYHYGLAVLGVMWIPGLVVILHQVSGGAKYKILPNKRHWLVNFILGCLFLLCFPLVPTILYLRLLLSKRAFRTSQEKLIFLQQEATSHEVKAIAGALESPLELILLLWMLLRGILQLPWDQTLASSCVGDSLGRVACFPSLPMASIIFSLLSILKTLCDLNISPIISSMNEAHSVVKLSYSWQLMAQLGPFFVCNALFRTAAFAFIITFLDYWAIIPITLVLLLNLVHTTLVSSDSHTEEGAKDIEFPEQPDNENPSGILNGDSRSSCSQEEDKLLSRPMPILLNSFLSILLPIAYSPHTHGVSGPRGKIGTQVENLSRRQARILRSQALMVNTCTLIVVVVVYCLVTHTSTFNYRSNILTPWWFKMAFSYLLLLYALSLPLSWFMEFQLVRKVSQNPPAESIVGTRSRHPTDQSTRVSVHSASSHLVTEEDGPAQLGLQVFISLLITLLLVAPSIVGIILFKTLDNNGYQLLQVKEQEDGLLHRHLTHLTSLNPGWRPAPVASSFIVGCDEEKKLKNSVLLVNLSVPECRRLHRRMTPGLFGLEQPRAVIILDDTPETGWRVSSPASPVQMDPSLPVFSAKIVDWSQEWAASKVSVVREKEILAPSEFSCSEDRDVFIGEASYGERCKRRKKLDKDGRIMEKRCVKTTCSKYGMPCHPPEVKEQSYECKTNLSVPVFKNYPSSTLHQMKFQFNDSKDSSICCIDETHYKQYHGRHCLKLGSVINPKCKFSSEFALYPCSEEQLQKNSKFCKIPNLNCIVQISYKSLCGGTQMIPCNVNNVDCKKSSNTSN